MEIKVVFKEFIHCIIYIYTMTRVIYESYTVYRMRHTHVRGHFKENIFKISTTQ